MEFRFIFLTGGFNSDNQALNDVERYDSISDTWESLPKLNLERSHPTSCTLGKTLYVLGGFNANAEIRSSIEKLVNINEPAPITSSEWQQIQPN